MRKIRSMLLRMKNVRVTYGKAEALRNVSIEAEIGEIVALIGSNGAGKTTTLRAICGLKALHSGEIWFRDRKINGMLPHDIVKMGIAHVPEGRRVFSTMTVRENLELGAYLRKDKQKIAEDLENIYRSFAVLKERQKQAAGSLSGGEQQMLAIGRALMAGPSLLLLDEPSLGLSPLLVREVARIIRSINQAGVSIILIEQNARMALRVAHKAYILEVGDIVLQGNAKDLANDEKVKKAYLGSSRETR
jgi:branched-chain amino acid transport system ATP-binding protein